MSLKLNNVIISFKRLTALLKTELSTDNYNTLEQSVVQQLFKLENLFNSKPIPDEVKLQVFLQQLDSYKDQLSATMKMIISWYCVKPIQSTSSIQPNKSTSAKSVNKTAKAKKKATNAPLPDLVQPLSRKKSKKVKQYISTVEKPYNCKITNCEICEKIKIKCKLTPCKHDNPHPEHVFPHVPRRIIRKIHATNDFCLLLTIDGFENPLNKDLRSEEQSEDLPLPSTAIKKRKLDDTDESLKISISKEFPSIPSTHNKRTFWSLMVGRRYPPGVVSWIKNKYGVP